jgi:hypothetical protein
MFCSSSIWKTSLIVLFQIVDLVVVTLWQHLNNPYRAIGIIVQFALRGYRETKVPEMITRFPAEQSWKIDHARY